MTKEQWEKVLSIVLGAALAVLAVFGWVINPTQVSVPGVIGSQAASERINLDSFGDNQISNGGDLIFWSGVHTGEKARIAGDTGVVSAVGVSATTITVTNLISTSVSFVGDAATITDITATNITGTLATAAQPNITSVGDLTSLSVGGGFGATGCSLSAAGVLQCDGAATIGGALVVTGTSTFGNVMTVNANGDFDTLSVAGAIDGTSIKNTGANPVTVNDNLVVTGTLSVNGETFTGPTKYGTAASYTNGAAIVHGFSVTPTMCMIWPAPITATVTITATGFSSDIATTANPVMWLCGQ